MLLPREDHCDPICVLLLGALYIHGVDMLCQQRGSLGISGLSGCFKGSNRFHKCDNPSDPQDQGILFTAHVSWERFGQRWKHELVLTSALFRSSLTQANHDFTNAD